MNYDDFTKKRKELAGAINTNGEYIDLYIDESNIDGWFTTAQLRAIADAMDELKRFRDENKSPG